MPVDSVCSLIDEFIQAQKAQVGFHRKIWHLFNFIHTIFFCVKTLLFKYFIAAFLFLFIRTQSFLIMLVLAQDPDMLLALHVSPLQPEVKRRKTTFARTCVQAFKVEREDERMVGFCRRKPPIFCCGKLSCK